MAREVLLKLGPPDFLDPSGEPVVTGRRWNEWVDGTVPSVAVVVGNAGDKLTWAELVQDGQPIKINPFLVRAIEPANK